MKNKSKYNDEQIIVKKAKRYKFFSNLIDGEKYFNFIEGLVALKKYDVQTRGEILTRVYKNFFNSDSILQEAKMEAYQNHYESFMKNNERDEALYSEILAYCIENRNYLHAVKLIKSIDSLQDQGLNPNDLPEKNKLFLKKTYQLKQDCGFNKDFDYEKFYSNSELRRNISQKIKTYLLDIEKINQLSEQETF